MECIQCIGASVYSCVPCIRSSGQLADVAGVKEGVLHGSLVWFE